MKLNPAEQESLVTLLTRIYSDICDIENEFQLLVGDSDFRPRIEYFHDAVRAFTSQNQSGGRLSVELLAYDLASLRAIISKPLAPFKPHSAILSPSTNVLKKGENQLAGMRGRPDRGVRDRLVELYQHYAVLFAALLKPFADRDYHDRTDNLNQDVEDLQSLRKEFEALATGKGDQEAIGDAILHVEDNELRQELLNFMHKQQFKKKENLDKLLQFLKITVTQKDKEIAAIDAAHMSYALAQLGIFEASRDMLKQMAKQGMNLVGKFVEASIAESRNEMRR